MKLQKNIFFITLFFIQSSFANTEICVPDPLKDLKNISYHIAENPVFSETLNETDLKAREKNKSSPVVITTADHEIKKLIVQTPVRVEFLIYPNSQVTILKWSDDQCGIKLAVVGKVSSSGEHKENNTCVEIQTEETEITPEGTSYIAETGALSNALAELNEEMGLAERIPSGTEETISVQKGTIHVRLRKAYKKGTRIKHTKVAATKNKSKNKSKIKSKTKSKMFALSKGKVKLRSGSSLKIKRNRKLKKQVADIEVITPE